MELDQTGLRLWIFFTSVNKGDVVACFAHWWGTLKASQMELMFFSTQTGTNVKLISQVG